MLHIDAHIDWAWIGDKDPRALVRARSLAQIESLLKERCLWNLRDRNPDDLVHIGNYIYPALNEGIVNDFYWVVPDSLMESPPAQRKLVRQFQSLGTINPQAMTAITVTDHVVAAAFDDIRVTACTLSRLPAFREPVLLDIDTDFLLTDPWGSARAGDDLWKQLPWIWPDELVVDEIQEAWPQRAASGSASPAVRFSCGGTFSISTPTPGRRASLITLFGIEANGPGQCTARPGGLATPS